MKITPCKMNVTPDQSREIQKIAIANGIVWQDSGAIVQNTHIDNLVITNVITCYAGVGSLIGGFNQLPLPLVDAEDFIKKYS